MFCKVNVVLSEGIKLVFDQICILAALSSVVLLPLRPCHTELSTGFILNLPAPLMSYNAAVMLEQNKLKTLINTQDM